MRHWHNDIYTYIKSLPSEFTHAFIGFSKFITTNIGTIPQYGIYTFGIGDSISYIAVGNANVGFAIIDNTENIDKDSVMAFVQEQLEVIENMLENY